MNFEIKKYFSTYCIYQIEAKNEEKAYEIVDRLKMDLNEIVLNLENWKEADECRRIQNNSK